MKPNLDCDAGAQNVPANVAGCPGFRQGPLHDPGAKGKLPSDVDVGGLGTDGIAGDENPLQHLVWVALHQLTVLEGPRLAFIRVAAEIFGALILFREESPLDTGRKACASTASQTGLLDQFRDLGGRDLTQHLP